MHVCDGYRNLNLTNFDLVTDVMAFQASPSSSIVFPLNRVNAAMRAELARFFGFRVANGFAKTLHDVDTEHTDNLHQAGMLRGDFSY
ncbi:hypothetical protein LAC03_20110 [Levilactobacillus acidifarinae]|nr:hypothetical protein LAC03_20110 [Levilactobacillus acidifarinae]